MKSPLAIMTVYSVASRLPSLRSALRGLDTTSVHGHLESWATARKPPAGALARKIVRTQTRYSWCLRKRGKSGGRGAGRGRGRDKFWSRFHRERLYTPAANLEGRL